MPESHLGGVEVYPYQRKAIDSLRNGSVLVGGVGSGKSLTALVYFLEKECGLYEWNSNGLKKRIPLYIISTARKRDTDEWLAECMRFCLHTDMERNLFKIPLIIDSWNNIAKYADVKDAFFIFDEQKAIGSGVWAKTFIKIAKKNRWIMLSATPGDTWLDYIPLFVANGFYKNRTEFLREHVVFSRYTSYPKVERYLSVQKLAKLKENITVRMIGRIAKDICHEDIITEYDKKNYDFVQKNRWNIYTEEPIQNASEYARVLRKIVNADPSRLEACKKLLQKYDRALIFYNFDYELDILRRLESLLNIPVAEWNGHKHEEIPESSRWAYLVQYTAGAEGWECIKTNVTIFYSQNYSYKVMVQAAGRINRLNSPYDKMLYFHLRSLASIDNTILKAIQNKRVFNEKDFFASQNFLAI